MLSAFETAETFDGSEVTIGLVVIGVAIGGQVRPIHPFDLEDEAVARSLFEELAASPDSG